MHREALLIEEKAQAKREAEQQAKWVATHLQQCKETVATAINIAIRQGQSECHWRHEFDDTDSTRFLIQELRNLLGTKGYKTAYAHGILKIDWL